jgi:hypothetical protein
MALEEVLGSPGPPLVVSLERPLEVVPGLASGLNLKDPGTTLGQPLVVSPGLVLELGPLMSLGRGSGINLELELGPTLGQNLGPTLGQALGQRPGSGLNWARWRSLGLAARRAEC